MIKMDDTIGSYLEIPPRNNHIVNKYQRVKIITEKYRMYAKF